MARLRWLVLVIGLLVSVSACGLSTVPHDEAAEVPVGEIATTATACAMQTAVAQATQTVEAGEDMLARLEEHQSSEQITEGPSTTDQDRSGMPAIERFDCDPCVISFGQEAILQWEVTQATTVTLDGKGVVSPGSTAVSPDQTSAYRLAAFNENGRSEKTVVVDLPGVPVVQHFTCLPCEMYKGELSTLSWDLSGGTAVYLDGQGVPAPGSVQVAPDQTTTYKLEAVGEKGSVERLVTVSIKEGRDPQAVKDLLGRAGYRVLWVGFQSVGPQEQAAVVVMQSAVPGDNRNPELLGQYQRGLRALYDSFPNERLTVGLYDGSRYLTFATVSSPEMEKLLRAELGASAFWKRAHWSVWDEWKGIWLTQPQEAGGIHDFLTKDFLP